MESVSQIGMKQGCNSTKFYCHPDRRKLQVSVEGFELFIIYFGMIIIVITWKFQHF